MELDVQSHAIGPQPEVEGVGGRRLILELVAASFIVLFQELALIRWLPGKVRVLAYFPNLILLSAFLGLGLGCLRAGRRSLLVWWPVALLLVCLAAWMASNVAFTAESTSEHLFLLYYDLPKDAPVVNGVAAPIVISFMLCAFTFVPLGQVVADRLEAFRRRGTPLHGYCWDIAGSLLGVIAFALASFAGTFPFVWFAVFLACGFVFVRGTPAARMGYVALAAAVLAVVAISERATTYSPYYAINVRDAAGSANFAVLTNGSLHQYAFALSRSEEDSAFGSARQGYHEPYRLLGRKPRRALVVGAGTGNDVSVLLDQGAEHVDAVEIDPAILRLGQRHPNRPYASPKVRTINTDARSFLNRTTETYDVIVFGTLDSMTRLSALSNVRLDNFVYTTECLQAARRRLTPDGGLIMYYMVPTEFIFLRLNGMVTRVFDEMPFVIAGDYGLFNRVLLAGPAFAHQQGEERRTAAAEHLRSVLARVELASDDWPYLYLNRRGITGFYLSLIAVFALVSVIAVATVSPDMRRSIGNVNTIDWEMFLFGLGFLLLETRSVTEMNLAWGGTWLTSAVVFASILAVVLAATLVAQWRPMGYSLSMVGLAVSLLVAYAVPAQVLVGSSTVGKVGLSVLFVGAPIFFAASCFAILYRQRANASTAFGWNLLGAVAGGLLEFGSMTVGLKALLLVALAAYLFALLIRLRQDEGAAADVT